jgi:hypothetical protein
MAASCTDPSLPAFVQPTAPTPPSAPADYPSIRLLSGPSFPTGGSYVRGTQSIDALTSDYPAGASSTVQFEVTGIGNSLSNYVVATAGSTPYGYFDSWNTTNVPDGVYWFYSVVCNTAGNCSDSLPIILTVDNLGVDNPTTSVLAPSNNASLTGIKILDASASDPLSVISSVQFQITGNGLSSPIVVPTTLTVFGYVGEWNTSGVTGGTYTLQSQACNTAGICANSAPITITINVETDLTSAVAVPSVNPATVSGTQILSATASDADEAPGGVEKEGINSLQFEIAGGSLSSPVIVTAAPYIFGWVAQWNTTNVPNGSYTLESVATDTDGVTGASPAITVIVNN